MSQILEAIYEEGVLKPLEDLDLDEHQRVVLELREAPASDAERRLKAWQQVYADLSDEDVREIEAIALDRSNFMSDP